MDRHPSGSTSLRRFATLRWLACLAALLLLATACGDDADDAADDAGDDVTDATEDDDDDAEPTDDADPTEDDGDAEPTEDDDSADAGSNIPGPDDEVEPDVLTVAYVSESYNFLPLYVAIDQGYFEEREVEVAPISLASSGRAMAALIGGSVQATLGSPGQTILASHRGEQVEWVGGMVNQAMYTVVGQPEIQTLEDLEGKRVGVAGTGTGDVLLLEDIFEAEGLDAEEMGISFIEAGGTPQRWAGLQSGSIDAGLLLSPLNYLAIQEGFSAVANAYEYVPEFQFTGINVNSERSEGQNEALIRFMLALGDATQAVLDDPELAHTTVMERLEIERDLAELAYDDYVTAGAFATDMSYSEGGLETVINQLIKSGEISEGDVTVDDFATSALVEAAAARR